jgi:hypothetical protein
MIDGAGGDVVGAQRHLPATNSDVVLERNGNPGISTLNRKQSDRTEEDRAEAHR